MENKKLSLTSKIPEINKVHSKKRFFLNLNSTLNQKRLIKTKTIIIIISIIFSVGISSIANYLKVDIVELDTTANLVTTSKEPVTTNTNFISNENLNEFRGIGLITSNWTKKLCFKKALLVQLSLVNITALLNFNIIKPKLIIWEWYDFSGDYHIQYNVTKISIGRNFNDRSELYYNFYVFIDKEIGVCSLELMCFYTIRFGGGGRELYDTPLIPSAPINFSTVLQYILNYSLYVTTPITILQKIKDLVKWLKKKGKDSKKDQNRKHIVENETDYFEKYRSYI